MDEKRLFGGFNKKKRTKKIGTFSDLFTKRNHEKVQNRWEKRSFEQKSVTFESYNEVVNKQKRVRRHKSKKGPNDSTSSDRNSKEDRKDEQKIDEKLEDLKEICWDSENLLKIRKNFYKESSILRNRTKDEIEEFRKKNRITVRGLNIPPPFQEFFDYELPIFLMEYINKNEFKTPTAIQAQGWPLALSGRDLVGIAKTGSGKTLAYIMPAIVHVSNRLKSELKSSKSDLNSKSENLDPSSGENSQFESGDSYINYCLKQLKNQDSDSHNPKPGKTNINHPKPGYAQSKPNIVAPFALILAPTRELAQQIHTVSSEVGSHLNIESVCVFGGAPKGPQIRELKKNCQILIATPGRLVDFLVMKILNLKKCSFLILDEADRMLDMGFEPQIRKIIQQTRPDRQTLMWSATWPLGVRQMAKDFVTTAAHLNIGAEDLGANSDIIQIVDVCTNNEKDEKMLSLVNEVCQSKFHKIIIFCQTKKKVDLNTALLRQNGWPALGLHGDKLQQERDKVFSEFRSGSAPILVATDVAARGLDVDDVKFVLNYDFPATMEEYIHRIGRTGRSGKKGTAYSFITRANLGRVEELIKVLQAAGQKVNPGLRKMLYGPANGKRKRKSFRSSGGD